MSKPFVLIPISLSHVCALFPQSTWTLLLWKCLQSAHASLHPFSCSYIHSILYCHFLFFTLFSKVLIKLPKKIRIFMSFFRFVDDNKGKNRVHLVGWVFLPPLRRDRCYPLSQNLLRVCSKFWEIVEYNMPYLPILTVFYYYFDQERWIRPSYVHFLIVCLCLFTIVLPQLITDWTMLPPADPPL